jgi:hypothetical protein
MLCNREVGEIACNPPFYQNKRQSRGVFLAWPLLFLPISIA